MPESTRLVLIHNIFIQVVSVINQTRGVIPASVLERKHQLVLAVEQVGADRGYYSSWLGVLVEDMQWLIQLPLVNATVKSGSAEKALLDSCCVLSGLDKLQKSKTTTWNNCWIHSVCKLITFLHPYASKLGITFFNPSLKKCMHLLNMQKFSDAFHFSSNLAFLSLALTHLVQKWITILLVI